MLTGAAQFRVRSTVIPAAIIDGNGAGLAEYSGAAEDCLGLENSRLIEVSFESGMSPRYAGSSERLDSAINPCYLVVCMQNTVCRVDSRFLSLWISLA